MKQTLTIAVSKGYLLKEALEAFNRLGITFNDDLNTSRKLSTTDTQGLITLLQVRPWDVPVYVEQGAADLGIAGLDVLHEQQPTVLRLMDLKFGQCKLVLAAPSQTAKTPLWPHMVIATKYPSSTQAYFLSKGLKVKLIKLYGSIELAPLTGLADMIVDLTATGKTLQENQLSIVDTLLESSAYLIANPVQFKVKHSLISTWVKHLQSVLV